MEYGGAICRCCGNTELERLQIDHVNNDGAEERRKLFGVNYGISLLEYLSKNGFPDKERFQVLCAGCNWSKSLNKGKLEIKFDWSKARFMTEQELINGLGIYDYAQLDPPNPGA